VSHSHNHSHGPGGHSHAPATFDRAFGIGIALNAAFVLAEAGYGLRAHSLSLVADAGHNLGDVLGLVLAWTASVLARRAPSARRTYGMRRGSILAAVANAAILLAAMGVIAWQAVQRFAHPAPVATTTVMIVAAVGIVINSVTAIGFMAGRHGDLNVRGAYLHMVGDAAVSAGVVVAGLVIRLTDWQWMDPAVSLVLVVLVVAGTWGLLRDSVNLAMDAVPASIDPVAVRATLAALPGVTDVHDLHIWGMSTTDVALTAHVVRPEGEPAAVSRDGGVAVAERAVTDDDSLLRAAAKLLHDRFGIVHATLQVERADHGCDGCT
jgi:cobalt-zinc-cadmium efflux system protein